jgi:hypothetical protein
MSVPDFITGNGEIALKGKFVSVRLLENALGKAFRLKVTEESPHFIKCKLVRFARIYGAPIIWPSARLAITIDNQTDVIRYKFYWPDYFLLTTLVAAVLIFNGGYLPKDDFLFLLLGVPLWAGIIFLDTKYVSSRVRKTLLKLSNT